MMDASKRNAINCLASVILVCCVRGNYAQGNLDFITLSNQTEYTVNLGDNVSLMCGFNLSSQTETEFIWFSPTGMRFKHHDGESSDYSVENGPEVVRLNITNATVMDDGLWNCTVSTIDQQSWDIVLLQIHLTVIAPPGQPLNLTLESVSYSWVAIQWQAPNDLRTYRLSFYNVTVYKLIPNNINSMEILIMEISTEDNETHANITGLQPGMSFRIQVAGVVILRNLSNIGLEQSCCSASLLVNTNIAAPMPICNSEPHLITSSMNSNNITFVVDWNYSHTKGLHLNRVVLSYSIHIRGYLGQVYTRTISESLSISQTLKMVTFSSMNVNSGTFVVNVTVFNSQDSNTVMCPPLYLEVNIIQLVLEGVQDCSVWVLHDAIEKQQVILNHLRRHIQDTCNGCEYTMTNHAIECADENSDIVILRTELFSPPKNMTENALDSIRSWIHIHSTTGSIVVQGLRLYLKRDCSLIVESFGSPFNCYQTSASTITSREPTISTADQPHPNTLTEVLTITGFLVCGILIIIVLLLVLYVGYQHYKKNSQKAQRLSNTGRQQDELQIPMVNINRLSTTSHISIPETISECEFEESENFMDEFELSASLAYGAVDSVTTSRLCLESDLESITEDLERTYNNPIYEGNPIYETIKVGQTKIDLRPISLVECESSDRS